MEKNLLFFGISDVGKARNDNQDRFLAETLTPTQLLLAAIDGVGGYDGGDIAADIAQKTLLSSFKEGYGEPLQLLKETVVLANNAIVEKGNSESHLSRMSCVLTTAVADTTHNQVAYVHVGDSRMYRLREGELKKITKDHSMVGEREDIGELSEEQAMNHPRRNEIKRMLGSERHRVDDDDFIDFGLESFVPGDWLLLCSDGLTDMITRAQITAILQSNTTLEEKTVALVNDANAAGGNDNITVVLAHYNAPSSLPALPLEVPPQNLDSVPEPEPFVPMLETPIKTRRPGLVAGLLLGLGLGAGLMWLLFSLFPSPPIAGKPELATSPVPALQPAISLLEQVKILKTNDTLRILGGDTLRLISTLVLKDTVVVVGNGVVILPAHDSLTSAFSLGPRAVVQFDSLYLRDFRVGIRSESTRLIFRGSQFKNVSSPIVLVPDFSRWHRIFIDVRMDSLDFRTRNLTP